jgi:hypothetical protein
MQAVEKRIRDASDNDLGQVVREVVDGPVMYAIMRELLFMDMAWDATRGTTVAAVKEAMNE